MTPRRSVVSSTILIAIVAAACGGSSPTQPANPSNISGVVREKLPGGMPGLPVKGVKVEVSGQPGGPASTTTDDEGRYTLVASGSFDLKFSKDGYQPTTLRVDALAANRTFDAALDPVLRTLAGMVTGASLGTPVVGATVEILSGSNKGRTTTTDTNGEYKFLNVWGDFDLSVSVAGYQTTTVRASVDATVTRVDVRLNPDAQVARSVFTGALCTVAQPYSYSRLCQGSSFPYPVQTHHSFDVQRPGTMTLAVSYKYVGDYYWNSLNVELRCGSRIVAEKRIDNLWDASPITRPDNVTGPVRIALPEACNYEIKLFNYIADRKGGDWTTYQVEVGYPR